VHEYDYEKEHFKITLQLLRASGFIFLLASLLYLGMLIISLFNGSFQNSSRDHTLIENAFPLMSGTFLALALFYLAKSLKALDKRISTLEEQLVQQKNEESKNESSGIS